jgi:uncharacterized protein with HEPN domain
LRRDAERLRDILDAAAAVNRYIADVPFVELLRNDMMQNAVLRQLTIIGEAANNLTAEFRLQHPAVSWAGAASFRHVVAHEYFRIDWEIVWETATHHLPKLSAQVLQILTAMETTDSGD